MTAQNRNRQDEAGIYYHIYNKGVEKRIIFNDEEDCAVFVSYLEDYLAAPRDPESIKREFKIHGRTFRGTPHQPKNYLNKVELLAYSLSPDHFHLLLYQVKKGSLKGFLRSLCTRYSIYFNKKYQRSGGLFEGPYKSLGLNNDKNLLKNLSRYFHASSSHSSYPEYLGSRNSPWIKINFILSLFNNKNDEYNNFVDNAKFDQGGKELIAAYTFHGSKPCIEKIDLTSMQELGARTPAKTQKTEEIGNKWVVKTHTRLPELLATAIVMLFVLTALGLRNIYISDSKHAQPLLPGNGSEQVLGTEKARQQGEIKLETPTPTPSPQPTLTPEESPVAIPKKILVVSTGGTGSIVNIWQEPTTESKRIGQAFEGEPFKFISEELGWYEIELFDGTNGFISADFIVEEGIKE